MVEDVDTLVTEAVWSMSQFIQSLENRGCVDVASKCWCKSEQICRSWTRVMQMSAAWWCRCCCLVKLELVCRCCCLMGQERLLCKAGAVLQVLLFGGTGTVAGWNWSWSKVGVGCCVVNLWHLPRGVVRWDQRWSSKYFLKLGLKRSG